MSRPVLPDTVMPDTVMPDTGGLDRPLALERLFGPWRAATRIVAAVSGGPDSMALLHLLARWRSAGNGPEIHVATVDHGLRPEAAGEAAMVTQLARQLGVDHAILVWRHDPAWRHESPPAGSARTPGQRTRLQERARAARYGLLAAHARTVDADVVMTAHHGDDQAETILFRLIRGSSIAGLAGMDIETDFGGVRLARPLLGLRKQELVDLCRARGIGFADDASNLDPRFARTRMRDILPLLEREGLGPDQWARLARRARRAGAALRESACAFRRDSMGVLPDGSLDADAAVFTRLPEEIALRVLMTAIADISGKAARLEQAERLLERLAPAVAAGRPFRATLGGACFTVTGAGRLNIAPERRRGGLSAPQTGPCPPEPGPPEKCCD